MRVGTGYDIHRVGTTDDSLRLGGIEIGEAPRLVGHSDGDVLIHAIIDALLGAAGQGDIGQHFPPGDRATQDVESRLLLVRVLRLLMASGYRVHNIDATVIAERPRLAPYLPAMRDAIAHTLAIPPAAVNVKATTHERLGEIGQGEAIAAMAVVLLDEG